MQTLDKGPMRHLVGLIRLAGRDTGYRSPLPSAGHLWRGSPSDSELLPYCRVYYLTSTSHVGVIVGQRASVTPCRGIRVRPVV